jgi:hypothetical protein
MLVEVLGICVTTSEADIRGVQHNKLKGTNKI